MESRLALMIWTTVLSLAPMRNEQTERVQCPNFTLIYPDRQMACQFCCTYSEHYEAKYEAVVVESRKHRISSILCDSFHKIKVGQIRQVESRANYVAKKTLLPQDTAPDEEMSEVVPSQRSNSSLWHHQMSRPERKHHQDGQAPERTTRRICSAR